MRVVRPLRTIVAAALAAVVLVGCTVVASDRPSADGPTKTCEETSQCSGTVLGIAELRQGWRDQLTGGSSYDPTAEPYLAAVQRIDTSARYQWNRLDPTGDPDLWADLDTTNLEQLRIAYGRLKSMAIAWATNGSALEGDPKLLSDIITAADWLRQSRYYPGLTYPDASWWQVSVGIPLELNDLTVVIFDELSAEQVDAYMDVVRSYTPGVTYTAANRVWAAMVVGVRSIIIGDEDALAEVQGEVGLALETVTIGDGFYADGSFLQHSYIAYTGGYGLSLLRTIARLIVLLKGSPWAITASGPIDIAARVAQSYEPFIRDGALMNAVRGREASRAAATELVAGTTALSAVVLLSESLGSSSASTAALRSLAKRWLSDDAFSRFWVKASISELLVARELLADDTTAASVEPIGFSMFSAMSRAVGRGVGFAFTVSTSSSRVASYESMNGENLRGWYTGDGMTALYLDGVDEYGGDYWATVDPYRLSGTTIDTQVRAYRGGSGFLSESDFAGGVSSASGLYGVTGAMLAPYNTTMTANKAWFFFDDEMVALGSGITATGQLGTDIDGNARGVRTTIDTRTIGPTATLSVNGSRAVTESGVQQDFDEVGWAQLSNGRAQIGYVLPDGAQLSALRETRTGAWSDINQATGASTQRSEDYVSLWFDHGANPTAERYSYIELPGASAVKTELYAARPDVQVLENTAALSAVRETTLGVIGAVFWKNQERTLDVDGEPFLSVDAAATVMTEEQPSGLSVAVSDPTQSHDGAIRVEINESASAAVALSAGVTVTQLTPTIVFSVDVTDAAGAPFVATFAYGEPPAGAE